MRRLLGLTVDYRLIKYPGAVHSFTVREAGNDPSGGMAYNEAADKASWQELVEFLGELFQQPQRMRAGEGRNLAGLTVKGRR